MYLLREAPVQQSGLIGKEITWLNDQREEMTGTVQAIVYRDGLTYAEVDGGERVLIMDIVGIRGPSE